MWRTRERQSTLRAVSSASNHCAGHKQARFPINNSKSIAWPVVRSMWLLELMVMKIKVPAASFHSRVRVPQSACATGLASTFHGLGDSGRGRRQIGVVAVERLRSQLPPKRLSTRAAPKRPKGATSDVESFGMRAATAQLWRRSTKASIN